MRRTVGNFAKPLVAPILRGRGTAPREWWFSLCFRLSAAFNAGMIESGPVTQVHEAWLQLEIDDGLSLNR
jgi:hypothetical protein